MKSMVILACLVALLVSAPLLAADVSGNWNFVFYTDDGERHAPARFQLDGNKVTGTLAETEVQGAFQEGKLQLSFPFYSAEAGLKDDLKIEGTLEGDTLSGNWVFSSYRGTFKATRAH